MQFNHSNCYNNNAHPSCTGLSGPEKIYVHVLKKTKDHESTYFHYQTNEVKHSLLSARLHGTYGHSTT